MSAPIRIPGPAPLTGSWHRAIAPVGVAVLNGATGVPHRFYRHFANWLATEHQVSCLTYDYRGFGASADGHVRDVTATMADWGIHDQQAARDWVVDRSEGAPLWVIGHSLGGLMLAHQSRTDEISRIIAVCSGPVHTTDHPWPYQAKVRALWYGLGPAAVAAFGYLPAQISGLGSDIPGPVFRQWRRWCTAHGFEAQDQTLPAPTADLRCALRTVGVSDDAAVPPHVARRLAHRHPNCAHEHVVLSPQRFGLKSVGHTSIFSRRSAAMWPDVIGP
ncbi:alpha/beta hydrolase family protein [Aliiroseovarius lamellibrachiae]|uniref:alpha/beta hydrolase family protein n=1 Tax=Aliiroseovarius lamellibrachiae TaxID=1924933 RepID=UPI001BE070E9|nr:alpha/beta fold hydrolase [Aliiroseovarius lamellibrachiae]MBT2131384.1 alpha/beta fold hydrolase [Aliiroseovarius lamellibrachiae]